MPTIKIKPLSVNKCWQGRRFKTRDYKTYEKALSYLLPDIKRFPKKNICIDIEVGLSSKNADLDNICKPLLDILQKKYDFNDRDVHKLILQKQHVKKGEEYIAFDTYQITI